MSEETVNPIDAAVIEQDAASVRKWTSVAMVFGFNELAKAAKTLGEKVFFRVVRERALDECRRLGVDFRLDSVEGDQEVLVLREAMPRIALQERDVDLMRAFLRDHDAASASRTSERDP